MDFDRIEKLKKRLYSRKYFSVSDDRSELSNLSKRDDDYSGWAKDEKLNIKDYDENNTGFLKKFTIFAVAFFLLSVVFSLYIFFFKNQFVSSNNLEILVSGPTSVSSGSDVLLSVSVFNKNKSDIESSVLSVVLPDGSVMMPDQKPIKDLSFDIGKIAKGQNINRDINFAILGNKDVNKVISFKIQYRIVGSNAVFVKEKKYDLKLDSSPVILNISSSKEINSGQNLNFKVDITSNSQTVLKNIYITAEYPYGFEFADSSLKNSSSNNEWFIGDLKNGDKKTLNITGKLIAQNNEERTFRFAVGSKDKKEDDISVIADGLSSVTIKKPFFNIVSYMGGVIDNPSFAISDNKSSVSVNFDISNTLNESVYDNEVFVNINSPLIDKKSIRVGQGGFYDSISNTITWNRNTTNSLSSFGPLSTNSLSFQFDIVDIPVSSENPKIDFSLKVNGLRTSQDSDSEEITSSMSKSIRIKTEPTFVLKTLYGSPLSTTGPNPPVSEKTTSYNLDFNISNTYNDINNATISIVLPQYVTFVGKTYPSSENIVYNEESREVLWNIGSISNSAGFNSSSKKGGFQIKITPSLNQIGTIPELTSKVIFSGTDSFTNLPIKINLSNFNTSVSGSPGLVK